MSVFQPSELNLSGHGEDDDDDFKDEEADQNRINAELENEMSGLSSDDDDDFEASEFHRHLRREPEHNTTGSFSEFDPKNIYEQQQQAPYTTNQYQHFEQYQHQQYQVHQHSPSRIPRLATSPRGGGGGGGEMERSPVKLYNESGGELDQVKVLYSASQRRVQELTVENENIKADMVTRCQELKHKAEMKQDQLDEQDAKMAQLRSELEQSENRAFGLDKKLTSFENANTNLAQQNSDFEKRQILQIAEIESLENELRIASSEDVIQKANMANRRKLDESRVQHKDETDRLKNTIYELKQINEQLKQDNETIEEAKFQIEKRMNRERLENGETINRLNYMLREAQNQRPIQKQPIDTEHSEVTFTGGVSSTPRDPVETAEHETIKRKYMELRDQALTVKNENQSLKQQLTDRLEDFNRLQQERDKFENLLKSSSQELHNFELFKQNVDEQKLMAIEDIQTSLKQHYDESLKTHLDAKEVQTLHRIKSAADDHSKQVDVLKQKITQIEYANDEIKNDYCKLAGEKETYERHYEKLERANAAAAKNKTSLEHNITQLQAQLKDVNQTKVDAQSTLDASNQTDTVLSPLPISTTVQTESMSEPSNDSINKLKVKFKREAQSWAKEKRRLESKIRHVETSNESGSTINSPRSEDSDAVKEINEKLERLKSEYQRSLSAIQADVKMTIDELRERNRAKVKHDVAQAQRRLSEKLHAQYKSLLNNIVDVERT